MRELEGQLEWVRSEREEEVQALKAERKALEQRAREAEAQLAQIKSRKKDELKVGCFECFTVCGDNPLKMEFSFVWKRGLEEGFWGEAGWNVRRRCSLRRSRVARRTS